MKSCGARPSFGNSFGTIAIAVVSLGLLANGPTYSADSVETCPPPPPQAKDWLELNQAAEKAYYNKELPAAARLFEQALVEAEKAHLEIERARTLNSFGVLKKDEKKYPEAEKLLTEALAIREKELGANHPCVGVTLNNLGELYEDEDKPKEAETTLLRALTIAEAQGADNAHAAVALNNLGALYYSQHKMPDAESYFQRALTAYKKSRPDDPQLKEIMEVLLNLYQINQRYFDFRSLYVEFARGNANASPAGLLKAARIMAQRGDDFARAGLNADAEAMYNRSLALFEAADQKTSPDYKLTIERYVEFLTRLKRIEDAKKLKKQE
jgi:tetratricopeptide (TPR) repeat protein